MSKYMPKFYENDRDLLILDNIFTVEDCADYASKHNLNVLFTETTSAASVETMMQFKKQGYKIELLEKEMCAPDGIKLSPKIYILFTKDSNLSKKNSQDYKYTGLFDKKGEEIKAGDIIQPQYGTKVFIEEFGSQIVGAFSYRPVGTTVENHSYPLSDLRKEAPLEIIGTIWKL